MSMEELLHTEHDLRDQNAAVDKHVTSLKGRIQKLRVRQGALEERKKKVGEAMSWEWRQTQARRRELQRAKAELEAKRQQIVLLGGEAEKMRDGIRDMQEKLRQMNRQRLELEERYAHPSLTAALVSEGVRGGVVSQHAVNKTVQWMVPEVEVGMRGVEHVEDWLQHSSAAGSVVSLLCIYALGVAVVASCARYVAMAQRVMTLGRMLFVADMWLLAMWVLICACYAAIMADPLEAMAREHGAMTMAVQLVLMGALLGNVALRLAALCARVQTQTVAELVAVVFVAQHYYAAVWVPIVMDAHVSAGALSYASYAAVNGALAVHRARSVRRALQTAREELHGGGGKNDARWWRRRLERALRYVENALTVGVGGSAGDLHSVADARRPTAYMCCA